jgi:nitroreductase
MDLFEAICTRKSVRTWQARPVEPEKLRRVLEAVRLAPSARNEQEWRFVVVTDREKRERLAHEASSERFMAGAPVIIAACAQTDGRIMRCGQQAYPIDVAIAIDHLTLAAVAEGLGTCWIGAFDPAEVRKILAIPDAVEVVVLLPLGYPVDPKPVRKSRLPYDTIVRFERW